LRNYFALERVFIYCGSIFTPSKNMWNKETNSVDVVEDIRERGRGVFNASFMVDIGP